MSLIYPQQINAAIETMNVFIQTTCTYVILFAMMQSGKTNTIKLIGCEMMRLGIIDNFAIIMGIRERDLIDQTSDHIKFETAYVTYLQDIHPELGYQWAKDMARSKVSQIYVLGGQDLAKFIPLPGKYLYGWDECHLVQNEKQSIDKFFKKINIVPNGSQSNGNYILASSATPFSELANLHDTNQSKKIVRIFPPEEYSSVEKLRSSGRLSSISDPVAKLKELIATTTCPGYGIIRVTSSKQLAMEKIASDAGWHIKSYNMKTKTKNKDINKEILDHPPIKPTIVFIRGMLRAGNELTKTYLMFGIETTNDQNTDTLLQGLLGRWCGYYSFDAPIFIVNLDESELDRYKICFWDDSRCIPKFARNIHGQRQLDCRPTIPCRIKCSSRDKVEHLIQSALENGTIENWNNPQDTETIMNLVRVLCNAKTAETQTQGQRDMVSKQWHSHWSGINFDETLGAIQQMFETQQSQFYGPGYGRTSKCKNEIHIFRKKGINDIYFYVLLNQVDSTILLPTTCDKSITKTKYSGTEEDEEEEEEEEDFELNDDGTATV